MALGNEELQHVPGGYLVEGDTDMSVAWLDTDGMWQRYESTYSSEDPPPGTLTPLST